MTRHFLRYWISHDGGWSVLNQQFMIYSASNQYDRVNLRDVIWAIVRNPSDKHLILVGCMTVDWKGSKAEASAKLQMLPQEMWDADTYVICDNPEPYDWIDINDYAKHLHFISATNNHLELTVSLIHNSYKQCVN